MLNQRFVLIILLSSSYWLVSAAEIPDSWEDAADIAELGGVANGAPAAQPLMAAAEPVGDEDLGLPRRQLRHPSLARQLSATNAAPDTMMTTGGGGGGSSEGLASPPLTGRSAVSSAYSDGGFFSSRRGQPASTVHTGAEQPSPTLSLGSARGRPLPNFSDSPQFETLVPIAEEAGMEQLARTLSADFAAAVPMELASPRTTKSPKTPIKSPPASIGAFHSTPARRVVANLEGRRAAVRRCATEAGLEQPTVAELAEQKKLELAHSRLAADDIRDLAAVANEESRGMGGDPERVDRHQEALKRLMAEQCGYPGEPEKLFTGPQQTELKKLKTPERAKRIYLKLRHDSAAHKNVQDAIRLETERPTGLQIGRFWVPDLEHIATRHLGRVGEPKISTRVELKTLGPDAKLKPGQKVGDVVAESQPATLFSWNKYKGDPSKVLAVLNRAKPVGELYNADKNSYQQLLIDEDGEPLQTLELAPGLDPRATPFRLLTTVYPYISLTRFETTGGSEKHAVLFNPDLVISRDKAQNLKRQIELSGAEVTAMARRALEKYDRNPKRVTNPLKFHGLDGQSDIFDISSELETNSRLKAAGIAVPEMSVLVQIPKLESAAGAAGDPWAAQRGKKARLADSR